MRHKERPGAWEPISTHTPGRFNEEDLAYHQCMLSGRMTPKCMPVGRMAPHQCMPLPPITNRPASAAIIDKTRNGLVDVFIELRTSSLAV